MANPWMDEERARAWQPTGKPGQALREEALAVVFTLLDAQQPRRIVDLGCGVGDIDARLLERFPEATLVAVDASPGMLARAGEALAPFGERATLLQGDLEGDWHEHVGPGVDVVVTTNAVHHVDGLAKRTLFRDVHRVLRPGGLFVLSDKLSFDPGFHPYHVRFWNCTRDAHGFERCPADWSYEDYLAQEQEAGDVPDTLFDQLGWLRAAGFAAAESFWQFGNRVVFAARKAAASA
jgi:SAM-dependent methyltransferase